MRKVPIEALPSSEMCAPPELVTGHEDQLVLNADEKAGTRMICNASGQMLPDMLPRIKNLVLQDRDLLEQGTKAFTAHIRAYKEHQCSFIFR
jgi:hypothetical protein